MPLFEENMFEENTYKIIGTQLIPQKHNNDEK